ncbi:MAG: YdaU family protein, partial [Burkholderiaceae bacterium]
MNYYPFHIGDYVSATAHLTLEEDCMYRRLLDLSYMSEKPLTLDERQLFRQLRCATNEHRDAAKSVLIEYFQRTEDGWIHDR